MAGDFSTDFCTHSIFSMDFWQISHFFKRVFAEIATFSMDFSVQSVTFSMDFCKFRIFPVTTSQTT